MNLKLTITRQHAARFALWVAIGCIINYTCYRLELVNPRYSIAFMNKYFDPLDLIFFASSHCSALIWPIFFRDTPVVFGKTIWLVLGLAMLAGMLVHLVFFVLCRRPLFYILIVLQVIGIVWAADCEIAQKHMTTPIVLRSS